MKSLPFWLLALAGVWLVVWAFANWAEEVAGKLEDRQRLFDLVRYCRHKLHNDGLI